MPTELRASDIASFLGASLDGNDVSVSGVESLYDATAEDFAFSRYDDPEELARSAAGLLICPESTPELDRALIRHPDPKLGFVKAAREFFADPIEETTIHPSAVVEDGAELGDRCYVGAQAYIGDAVTLGDDCRIHAGTTLGEPGFGFARDETDRPLRQPHLGEIVIGDDVEIGANSSVDRAAFSETVIGDGSVLSAQVHIAHQVFVGENVSMAYGAGVSGSTEIGDRVVVQPHVAVAGHLTVGDDAELGIGSTVLDDVDAGTTVVGSPARPIRR
ncbi:DapH/DapD/GlmU-related protein [Haloprofundus salinisoli]|uniref:DapH/DapD/GlmU-related protein n=1 Tax=Haloprofundus salinisoli TaxID=2876193 RepID=UPI001CCF80B5|nr:DapH/DapD/GlmU-related protein [Haloprofundus salinisoli]